MTDAVSHPTSGPRPTARSAGFVVAGVLFYFFANQTQVGWLYIASALCIGAVLGGWLLNRRTLRAIRGERSVAVPDDETPHEGDPLRLTLALRAARGLPQVSVLEHCPLAAPDEREKSLFVPALQDVRFDYDVEIYQRGVYQFPQLRLATRTPFGFFQRRASLDIPTEVLVYPQVIERESLDLLDRQPAAQQVSPRAGIGNEVIGVRGYRLGDSPRHIHWRGVARRGTLVSKEFAEETRPGVTLVLDRYDPYPATVHKHRPFEYAIKQLVSVAEYATKRGYPIHLAADQADFAAPGGALVWDALMQYLARVPARDQTTVANVLRHHPLQQYVAVALSYPDPALAEPLLSLHHRGLGILVLLPDMASFDLRSERTTQDTPSSERSLIDALQPYDIAIEVFSREP